MIGAFLGGTMHVIYIILFSAYKINILLWFNILISMPVFITAFILSYKGKLRIPPLIGTIEVAVHQMLGVLLIGQETGFHVMLLCLIPIGILFQKWKISFFVNSFLAFILYLSVVWFDSGQFKIYELHTTSLTFIRVINSLGLFTIVGLILFYYISLNKKLYDEIQKTNEKLFQINNELNETIGVLNVQKDKIESQHKVLFEQNKSITDSINYAGRIQAALLPQKEILEKTLPDHFILFLPKEIVSGDFYWASQVDQKIIFCVADCTGHGVPGAFMSLLGIAFLDEIVNRRKVIAADEILNNIRMEVIKALKQTGKREEQKDGMDIALCIYDKEASQIEFAGANSPLYLVSNGELEELIADKMPISYFIDIPQSFHSKTIKIKEGDIVYIFSDGYADQFGGPNRAKYKHGPLKDYIQKIYKIPISEQKILLKENFNSWRGDQEQTDDVILMGIKF
jgi:serine phosphatase RsbU (regulator of sigma subunit)